MLPLLEHLMIMQEKWVIKRKRQKLEGNDIREGLTAIVSVRIPEEKLQFEGQTKGS